MNPTVGKVLELLRDERLERRCAAAMVLGELGVRDAAVSRALADALADENRVLRLYCLEALVALGASGVVEQVVPLLDSQDEEVRRRAQAVLERQGSKAAKILARDLASAPLSRRRALVEVLARVRTPETISALLARLSDPDVAEHTLAALRGALDGAPAGERAQMARRASAHLSARVVREDVFATVNTLRLVGYVGDAASVPVLTRFLAGKVPSQVRAAAVGALRRPLAAARQTDAVTTRLLQLADDADTAVARAALDTLRNLEIKPKLTAAVLKLCDARHPEVRAFAAERLGSLDTESAARRLLETLRAGEPAAREAAARSLARLTSAVKPALDALGRETEPARIAALGRVLRAHAERVPAAARKQLAARAGKLLEKGAEDPRAAAMLDALAALDPRLRDQTLLERGLAFKKAGKLQEAFAVLRPLARSPAADDESRFALATVALSLGGHELSPRARASDPALQQLAALLSGGFPVLARLKKERHVSPEHLFYVGFNFVESSDGDERELGADLLSHLAHKSPGSKVGKNARNKLKLAGLDEAA